MNYGSKAAVDLKPLAITNGLKLSTGKASMYLPNIHDTVQIQPKMLSVHSSPQFIN